MKLMNFIFLLMFLVSCAEKPMDQEEAKRTVEELILKTDAEDFEAVANLYTAEFNSSEPMEVKKEKLLQLKKVLGKVKSLEFISATHVAEFGQPKKVVIEYKVLHSKIASIETFSVVEDEGGYKIASHSVKSDGSKF